MDAPQPSRAHPGRRSQLVVAPLFLTVFVMLLLTSSNSGPYHGKIRAACCGAAALGAAIIWFEQLRSIKRQLKDRTG